METSIYPIHGIYPYVEKPAAMEKAMPFEDLYLPV